MIESKELERILSLPDEESLLHLLVMEKDCKMDYNIALHRVHAYYDQIKKYATLDDDEMTKSFESYLTIAEQDFIKAESELKEIRAKIKAFIMNA